MADRSSKASSPTLKIRTSSARLIRPDELAARIENMYPTEEGTLRSIRGPTPYQPDYASGGAPSDGTTASASGTTTTYAPMHGICHAVLREGTREVLLVHTGDQLWVFEGWNRGWRELIGPSGDVAVSLDDSERAQFPTQFVVTPIGIVIIPQGRRAYFYDGDVCLPLGYDSTPQAPTALGPESSEVNLPTPSALSGVNDARYAHDGLPGRTSGMHQIFREGRLGLVVHPTNYTISGYDDAAGNGDGSRSGVIMSWLEPGEWRTRVQWIDRWGNVSPLSDPSEPVSVERQMATGFDGSQTQYVRGDLVRKQFAWMGIPTGPEGTIGRILCRTRDLKQSGDTSYYEVPLNARSAGNALATLPDNVTAVFPDNIPDEWLFKRPLEPDPVPQFKLGTIAMGRLWIANIPGAPGLIRPSAVGRWGTFPKGLELYPDPTASAITGLHAVSGGLLVFTETSTYMVTPNDRGDGFRSATVSSRIGCVAPDSIVTLPDGTVVWLGRDGFYAYQGGEPQYIFSDMRREVRDFTKGRMLQAVAVYDEHSDEYRCWLSVEGSKLNNRCYIFNGRGWRRRTDVRAMGACVTQDARAYVLLAGKSVQSSRHGVWVQDVETSNFSTRRAYTHVIETGWLSSEDSRVRASTTRVTLWLRESITTANDTDKKIQVDVFRDWREVATQTATAQPYPTDDVKTFWGETALGTTGAVWSQKRPFWTKVDIDVRSAEVFKLKIRSEYPFEFIGLQFDYIPRNSGGARLP